MKFIKMTGDIINDADEKIIIYNNYVIIKPLILDSKLAYDIAYIISYMPFSDRKEKTFFNLNDKNKVGLLYNHMIKCAVSLSIPQVYINKFIKIKNICKFTNLNSEFKYRDRKKLISETRIFIKAIIESIKSKSIRSKKLEDIFFT